ncbi:patched domain-containing protein 3 [Anopheles arabiensis]|uniref:SSD domain-containing protein n=1 Tax=Anopheles arabiensis TaxID=7173 RepID=A0A8W7M3M6_ANOAR|nr:patched domain-containing protein 3 [Anopheles arabiensis]XP_040169199.1 patched domain-containing protein 3 [Anopheles arabiensis]XP_040169200.1 patched domain-containing protein 3 [Anopheles arabiensis]XP_040169201.1 patched domain-containing protein 3 [Anopheles arabiensis]
MTCGISCVDNALNKSFFKLGLFIGRHPGYFLIVPVLLALLCMTGFQQIKYEIDPEYLFSPVRGEGKSERAIVESYFKVNYTHRFNVGRITRPGRFGRVIVISKDEHNKNLLRSEVWQELRLLDGIIQNATVQYDGESFTYREACARWENECFTNDILNLDKIIDEVEAGDLNLTFPVMFNPVTWDAHVFPVFFGGTQVSEDNLIVSVPSLQLVYFVTADSKRQDARGAAWEEAFLEAVGYAEDHGVFKYISVARFASRTLDHELERNTRTVVPYFSSTFVLMIAFSVVTCMMGDVVRSKPWLGLMGNVSAVMATSAAFGLAMYLGIEFIGINLAAPFLMIGIGIDDTFVMLAAWRRTSVKLSVPERMGHMMSEAAVSITITSLTDMISFWIGILSPFPSVQIFCAYSGFAVCFTYLWHVTFFAGCMAVSGHCEFKNLHTIFGYKVLPESVAIKEKRSWLYRKMNTGGINRDDPDNPIDNREHVLMAFFRETMARILNKGWTKTIILVIFAAYLGGACFGLTKIKEGLERRKLSKADSYSVKFFDLEDEYYREFPYRIQVIVTGDLNYSDPHTQMQIEDLMQSLENTSYVTSPLYSESWLRSFISYVDRNNDYLNLTLDSEQAFIDALREIWLFPANPFSLDVKFNEAGTKILASRFMIQAVNITDTNHEKVMVKDLRQICKDSPLNATVFHPYFVFFDQFELVRPTSIQSMIVGALIMMLISFIFIPNFLCSLWVAFSIISIELGVAGYMALWDVNLDSISMINLIMCIGFSVDFTAHICYTYMSSKARTPDERVREALYSLGMPIVQGSLSTILGVVALLLADSYIFLVFFKMVFLVIFFGAMHGLFLLPVLLSLFGPGSCTSGYQPDDDHKLSPVEKTYPHPYCISHPQLALTGAFGSKNFLGAPYKAYGEDKDLGIGTSGEDSSESSSSKSQRRQAIEDENTRRRYEEGWRRSTHNLTGQSQFQPMLDLYGQEALWTKTTGKAPLKIANGRYGYEDMLLNVAQGQTTVKQPRSADFELDRTEDRRDRRKSDDERYKSRYEDNRTFVDDEMLDDTDYQHTNRYYVYDTSHVKRLSNDSGAAGSSTNNNPAGTSLQHMSQACSSSSTAVDLQQGANTNRRKFSDESDKRRRHSDERRPRKFSPPEGIYKQNPHRSSSQHNLYYPRQPPQRTASQSSLHQLRHMGDMRFP